MLTYQLEWKSENQPVRVYGVGDVTAVLNSRVTALLPLPPVSYGLGAMTSAGADRVGEGMVLRGRTSITPPTPHAGSELEFHPSRENISTPFCLGWEGEPVATGWFKAQGGTTLLGIYETLLNDVRSRFTDIHIILLEMVGLLPVEHIYDRALKKPVDQGNVLVTAPQYQHDYFRAGIIRQELVSRAASVSDSLAMAIVGLAYLPGGSHPSLQQLESSVFYTPPALGNAAQPPKSAIKTHSHAEAWNDPALFKFLQNTTEQGKPAGIPDLDRLVEQAAAAKPDFIVHLDEWSQITSGWLRVFVAAPDAIIFQ